MSTPIRNVLINEICCEACGTWFTAEVKKFTQGERVAYVGAVPVHQMHRMTSDEGEISHYCVGGNMWTQITELAYISAKRIGQFDYT